MLSGIEARYLTIEWQAEGVARAIERAPVPLEIVPSPEGGFLVETTIFNDFHPWFGIRLGRELDGVVPSFVATLGMETPMLRIKDPEGRGYWWLQNDGWNSSGKRHLSELQRSAGTYIIHIGEDVLRVENRLSSFGRADIQAYVDDFRGDLLWMIMSPAAGATATAGGAGGGAEFAVVLEELRAACQRVLISPAVAISEGQARQPVARVHPKSVTFREYAWNPAARQLTGRTFEESANTAENRYLRHMLAVSIKAATAFIAAASLQSNFLNRLASRESDRAKRNREMNEYPVDPEVFDEQTEIIRRKIGALAQYKEASDGVVDKLLRLPIRLGSPAYKHFSFYYERQESTGTHVNDNIEWRIAVMPKALYEVALGAHHVCRDLTIEGNVKSSVEETRKGRKYRQICFSSVREVRPQTKVLERRAETRRNLAGKSWIVPISNVERLERRREAASGEHRAAAALARDREVSSSVHSVEIVRVRLTEIDRDMGSMGISSSSDFPMGMRFVSNPEYAASFSKFKKVIALFESGGLDIRRLEEINNIGILHASDIYEKWCMLKIIMLLIHDFRFVPARGWEEKLIATSLSRERNVSFDLSRSDPAMKIVFSCQAEMPTGRRPDFVLEVLDGANSQCGGIVMDAKFRSSWKGRGPRRALDELVLAKDYGEALKNEKVFILQPCESTVSPVTSPLEWGRHCSYGGESDRSHRQGWIQTGVTSSGKSSDEHLKRLLAMVFQEAFPEPFSEPQKEGDGDCTWVSHSFCIGCGERHSPSSISMKDTKGGGARWRLDCKQCGVWTVRTHCYSCKKPLFKNGTIWTYHETVADQVTHVICPHCGSYFDEGFNRGD